MVFHKEAFLRREHEEITKYIMGERFDPAMFAEVHTYIDGMGGFGHRERHGHNEEAEKAIHKRWGHVGVDIFKIHILSDSLYDSLGSAVQTIYNAHIHGTFPVPYYRVESTDQRPSYGLTTDERVIGCKNCGSPDLLDPLQSWIGPSVCSQCLTVRNLEVCVQCEAFFSKADRVDSPENPGRYLCQVCAPNFK